MKKGKIIDLDKKKKRYAKTLDMLCSAANYGGWESEKRPPKTVRVKPDSEDCILELTIVSSETLEEYEKRLRSYQK